MLEPRLTVGTCRGYHAPPPQIVEYFAQGKGLKLTLASGQIGFVLAGVIAKLKTVFASAAKVMREALRPRPCSIVSGLATDLLRSRAELAMENVLLRQQLIVAGRRVKRPVFRRHERTLVTLLAAALPRWRDALLLVKPETVLRRHREGFRLLWRWKSRPKKSPAPRISSDVIELIQRMAAEKRLWGAEGVRGELIKLGIDVAKRTVQRYMRDRRNPAPPRGQNWHTFLRNHTVWACDFLQVYDVWFRPIFAFFIVDINTKRVVHLGVARHPTAQWTAQQLREATPFGDGPQFIIRDNDGKFGADFDRAAKGAGIRVLRTAVQAPLMNFHLRAVFRQRQARVPRSHRHPRRAAHRARAHGVLLQLFQRRTAAPEDRTARADSASAQGANRSCRCDRYSHARRASS